MSPILILTGIATGRSRFVKLISQKSWNKTNLYKILYSSIGHSSCFLGFLSNLISVLFRSKEWKLLRVWAIYVRNLSFLGKKPRSAAIPTTWGLLSFQSLPHLSQSPSGCTKPILSQARSFKDTKIIGEKLSSIKTCRNHLNNFLRLWTTIAQLRIGLESWYWYG